MLCSAALLGTSTVGSLAGGFKLMLTPVKFIEPRVSKGMAVPRSHICVERSPKRPRTVFLFVTASIVSNSSVPWCGAMLGVSNISVFFSQRE